MQSGAEYFQIYHMVGTARHSMECRNSAQLKTFLHHPVDLTINLHQKIKVVQIFNLPISGNLQVYCPQSSICRIHKISWPV